MANSISTDVPAAVRNGRTTAEDVDTDNRGTFQTRFGYLRCRPDRLQFLTSARWFLLFMFLTVLFQSMIVNGLVGVTISTIERRFALTSSQTAWIVSSYEIAGVPALLLIGYIGSSLHRPVWMGSGLVVLGIGFGIYSIPHFAAPPYRYSGDSINLCVETAWNKSNDNASLSPNNRCSDDDVEDGSRYLAAFIVAMVLQSIGNIPTYVLGVTYLDDASPHGTAALHMGIFYSAAILGPVVAYICGGYLLRLYTHFDTIDTSTITLQQNDPRWVGAWWVGFLAAMVIILLIAPVFFGYPPDPATKHHRETTISNRSPDSEQDQEPRLDLRSAGLSGVVKAVKSLVTNGPYMFIVLYGTFDAIIVNGFTAFGAKYFQQQFSLTPAMAGIIFGVVSVPGGAGGLILAGIITKKMSLTAVQQMRGMFMLAIVCLFALLGFCIQCDSAQLADVTSDQHAEHTDRNVGGTCSLDCSCEVEWFEPVCGSDGLTYFSPCYAGCHNFLAGSGYGNCSCIGDVGTNTSDVSSTAVDGVCDVTSCHTWRLAVFFVCFFVAMIIIFLCEMFHVSAMLRIVGHSERPFAYSIDWLFLRLGGGLPGPILFGFALDHSCLLWEKKCDGSTGACLYYDNHHMAWLLLAVCASCKLLTIVCSFIAWRMSVHKDSKGDAGTGNNCTLSEDITGDDRIAASNPALEMENSETL